jgi:leucyl-tRNA synthetase
MIGMPYNFTAIEKKWQQHWLENRSFAALEPAQAGGMPKKYILDMFPYPSGAGLHVGHPEGYTATDILSRYWRMKGCNVLHPMGWDAFGLPAEQYAVKNNVHPAVTTRQNVDNFRRQIQMLGLSYDWDREVNTTDPGYYRWTQWIFLQLYHSYFDPIQRRAMPIGHLIAELQNDNYVVAPDGSIRIHPVQEGMEAISGDARIERVWRELSAEEQRGVLDGHRLAYTDEVAVNWCPQLGTVLANEEVIDGRSEVGGYPVEKRPMRQWMLRITKYADRLLEDLETLDWPESIKEMQRNWIGRSTGAEIEFVIDGHPDDSIIVFTTRPDTLYGATYMVLAPEHPLVDEITTAPQKSAVAAYRAAASGKSERDRMEGAKDKTGVFTGAYAINPINDEKIPVWIADYVLMGYGTGAIMAVPAHDERDYAFAEKFHLPIRWVVGPAAAVAPQDTRRAFVDEGVAINSPAIDGLATANAKERMIEVLEGEDVGRRRVQYKLRDWLFSRQRYWGEPFPIVLDEAGNHYAVPEDELPVALPNVDDFKPTGTPEPPLSKARNWIRYSGKAMLARADEGVGAQPLMRETNTMPQWAGSCWYYLRYLDPTNETRFVDPEKERYWMPVDLYVGGVEHAVLHLLYARFWHKVLFDLGHVSTAEPFGRLVNQGLILGETEYHFFEDASGQAVSAAELRDIAEEATEQGPKLVGYRRDNGQKLFGKRLSEVLVEKSGDRCSLRANPSVVVDARSFKMSKSRGNVVNPDDIVRDYGADAFRLYEMYMGPLEAQKPWSTRDIVGMSRFLNAVWRHFVGDEETRRVASISEMAIPEALDRQLHRTIRKVGDDIEALRFNTAIAELIKLNNEIGRLDVVPRSLAETFTLLLAPFAPHLAEELWSRLGHPQSLAREPWPAYDPARLHESTMEIPVQVNGKLRDKVVVPADATEAQVLEAAAACERVRPWIEGKSIRKQLYVPKKLVNFVV